MKTINYKGKGEHSVRELELIIEQQAEELYLIKSGQKQLHIHGVVSSSVDKGTLIKDLNDKRIVGKTIDKNMWYYCRKETAEHLLDKYEIKPK